MPEIRDEQLQKGRADSDGTTPQADSIADALKGKGPVVPFRGYLTSAEQVTKAEQASGDERVRRLYTSPCFDQWLEIRDEDILYQQRGFGLLDLNSIVWVKQTAQVKRFTCASGEAREFIERPEDGLDPTTGGPRYGHH